MMRIYQYNCREKNISLRSIFISKVSGITIFTRPLYNTYFYKRNSKNTEIWIFEMCYMKMQIWDGRDNKMNKALSENSRCVEH